MGCLSCIAAFDGQTARFSVFQPVFKNFVGGIFFISKPVNPRKGSTPVTFLRELLTNPLFIIKRLQKNAIRKYAFFLKGQVCDVGCGTQPYRRYLPCDGYVGVDADLKLHPDVVAQATALPFADNSFDGVLCTEVIEHLEEPQVCLDQIRRILKKEGYLCLTAPQSWGLHYEPHDFWRFTKYGLELLLKKYDFEVVVIERIGGPFSSGAQEFIDVMWTVLTKIFHFMGGRWAQRCASLLCAPWSLFFYVFSRYADRLDQRFAIGWLVIGRRR